MVSDCLLFIERLEEFSGRGHTRTHFIQESNDSHDGGIGLDTSRQVYSTPTQFFFTPTTTW